MIYNSAASFSFLLTINYAVQRTVRACSKFVYTCVCVGAGVSFYFTGEVPCTKHGEATLLHLYTSPGRELTAATNLHNTLSFYFEPHFLSFY